MDEPTANLDFGNQVRVMNEIRSLAREGYTIIQSSHNPDQTFLYSDRILALQDGKVLAHGSPAEIVNEDLMRTLYGIDIEVSSLYQDRVRVCIPKSAITDVTSSIPKDDCLLVF
jgi:iron complex transport system ATP-binding protein